ncbi:hypothetical protein KY290_000995 [Solanum tuberosum]|uniref:Reverse transcriptase domain-containing protein n=1 Tax=Solanum tuberosum TaxID=4113 RepID=A0ABQ7WN42_SOLTU|nr:hypothetical protein KY290_000995 [Solanum tuberosum]
MYDMLSIQPNGIDLSRSSCINAPTVLPKEQWIPYFQNFNTASKGILTTRVITNNPITIEFFPGVQFRTKLLGIIPGTDLIIGFDSYKQLNDRLKVKTQGIAFGDNFKQSTTTTRLLTITEDERVKNIKSQLVEESCDDSHKEFMKKHDNPLWLNKEFFISIPFKRNENINLTRASHSGMNPKHLQLAKKECDELLEYELIEPSDSQWSCEAFYVNKRAEQTRAKTKYFSKFDLKSGFWQLGIHPEDKSTMVFCIPDHHYQWKFMLFGLKPAPSLFQKAMIKIFQPILHTSLDEIDFLGMHFTHGAYIPGPHICEELVKFPDTNFTVKQLQ